MTRLFRWLKGSKGGYLLGFPGHESKVRRDERPYNIAKAIIEVNRGFWRRKSRICARKGYGWKLAREWGEPIPDGILVSLTDKYGMPLDRALRLMDQHNSLWSLFDSFNQTKTYLEYANQRIAELENQLQAAEQDRQKWASGVSKLISKIIKNKQRFKSQPAKEIRQDLELMLVGMEDGTFDDRVFDIEGRVTSEAHS